MSTKPKNQTRRPETLSQYSAKEIEFCEKDENKILEDPTKDEKILEYKKNIDPAKISAIAAVLVALIGGLSLIANTYFSKASEMNIVANYQEAKLKNAYKALNDKEIQLNKAKDEIQEKLASEKIPEKKIQLELAEENITKAFEKTKKIKDLIYEKTDNNIQNLKDNKIISLVERDQINMKLLEEGNLRKQASQEAKKLNLESLIEDDTVLINKARLDLYAAQIAFVEEQLRIIDEKGDVQKFMITKDGEKIPYCTRDIEFFNIKEKEVKKSTKDKSLAIKHNQPLPVNSLIDFKPRSSKTRSNPSIK